MPKTLFASLIVLLFSCSSSRHRYFEGEIDYKITSGNSRRIAGRLI
ncbi:MAG: hypothetical protein JST42_09960 [Bacteroidetes bacterium]|nr:hypothetical protein [Bacteroidota bacterium]